MFYTTSTLHDYGISFTSNDTAPMHSYVHFPPSSDAEAYDDAIPPTLGCSNTISAYSDACWGSQLGSSVANGTLLPLFKFRSMSGGIVFKNGGPIGWLWERQDRTSLSSCEAEIHATNATSKKVVDFRNLSRSVSDAGYNIPDVDALTLIYNDNDACVKWSYNMTSKAAWHIELRENSVRENGFRIGPSTLSTSLARLIQQISSLKKCAMVRISVAYETHSCLAFPIS